VTGYTTNFHGFYSPLQVLYSMAKGLLLSAMPVGKSFTTRMLQTRFMDRLNLTGTEGKNLVRSTGYPRFSSQYSNSHSCTEKHIT